VTEFGGLNDSPGKRVLNNLKTICLRFWKVVIERVAVIKHRVNNRCGNGTGSFEVKIGADTTKLHSFYCIFYLLSLQLQHPLPWSESRTTKRREYPCVSFPVPVMGLL